MRLPRRLLPTVLAFAALASGACGDGDDIPPVASPETSKNVKWIVDICDQVTGFLQDLQDRATGLVVRVETVGTPAEAQALLVGFFAETLRVTDKMTKTIGGLEDPPIPGGAQAAERLRANLPSVRTVFAQARDDAAQLPVADPAAFAAARDRLLGVAHEGAQQLRAVYADLEKGEPHHLGLLGSQEINCNRIYSDGPDGPLPGPGFTI